MNVVKQRIKAIRQNKDKKVLTANFLYLFFLQIIGYVLPLITLPYIAKIIGVVGFGKIAFAAGIIIWMQTITDWGFNYTATRDVSKIKDDKNMVSDIFSNVLWSRITLMIISFVLLLLSITFISKFRENRDVIIATFLMIPGYIMTSEWFYQAIEKMKFITMFSIISKILFTISVFLFLKNEGDYILQPVITSIATFITGSLSLCHILTKQGVKLRSPNILSIINTIKNSTDVFINNLMPIFYNGFSVVLLGFWGGSMSNGIFDAGSKFSTISLQLMRVLSRVFFPFLSRRTDKHSIYVKISMWFAVVMFILIFISAPLIIKFFFTPEFYNGILVLRIMSVSIFFSMLIDVYGVNYMIINGYERKLRNITTICSFLGFLLAFPLIYFFDYIGTAITITLTRAMLGVVIAINAIAIKSVDSKFLQHNV